MESVLSDKTVLSYQTPYFIRYKVVIKGPADNPCLLLFIISRGQELLEYQISFWYIRSTGMD